MRDKEGAAVPTSHCFSGFGGEVTVFFNAFGRRQIEIDPGMDAALAKMAVERAMISVAVEKIAQVAQISADFLRRNRGVLPALPGIALSRSKGRGAEPRFADLPNLRH